MRKFSIQPLVIRNLWSDCAGTTELFCVLDASRGQLTVSCFPDYLEQLECVPHRREFSVFSSFVRGNLGNYSKLRRNFDTVLCRNIWEGGGGGCTLPHEIWLSFLKVMSDFTGSGNPWTQSCWPRDWPPCVCVFCKLSNCGKSQIGQLRWNNLGWLHVRVRDTEMERAYAHGQTMVRIANKWKQWAL